MSLLYINESAIRETGLLEGESLGDVWNLLASGLIAFGEGKVVLPLDAYLRPEDDRRFDRIIAKAGLVEETAGLKWIASAPRNTGRGLPRASGLLILNDVITGQAYAILDAVPISNARTAAVSMLFLRQFRPGFSKAVIFGTGVHGREHLRQLLFGLRAGYFPELREICLYDRVAASAEGMQSEFDHPLRIIPDLADCFTDDTALIFCTNALTPHIDRGMIEGRRGLSAVHMSLRDLEAETLSAFDHCVTDSTEHVAKASTSVDLAIRAGLITRDDCMEIGDLLIGQRDEKPMPFNADDNTVFNPMGLGSHDLLLGRHVYEHARKLQLGVELPT